MAVTAPERLHFTDSDEANELLAREPMALPAELSAPLDTKPSTTTLSASTRIPGTTAPLPR